MPDQSEDLLMEAFLVLVLSLSKAATQDKPVAPEEQYKALLKEFGEAAHAQWKATTDDHRTAPGNGGAMALAMRAGFLMA